MEVLGKRVLVRWESERKSAGGIVLPGGEAKSQHKLRPAIVLMLGDAVTFAPGERSFGRGDRVLVASYGQELEWDGTEPGEPAMHLVQSDDVAVVLERAPAER